MSSKTPSITLNNSTRMPALGLGTLARDALDLVAGAVESAIAVGYRLIDTAASYQSERAVGEGVRRTGINRSELFVTTKLVLRWHIQHGLSIIPKSVHPKRIAENFDIFQLHADGGRYLGNRRTGYGYAPRPRS